MSFIAHGNEAANCGRMLITVDMLGEIKRDQAENSCLLFLNVCVATEFVYANTITLSSISVNSGF